MKEVIGMKIYDEFFFLYHKLILIVEVKKFEIN